MVVIEGWQKLCKVICEKMGRNRFSNRMVREWNGLSNQILSAESLGSFKRRLDRFMDENDRLKKVAMFLTGTTTCRPYGFFAAAFIFLSSV